MYSLAQPGFLALGAVLLLPGLLRYRRVWQYSNARLLRNAGQRDLLSICLNAVTWIALGLLLIGLAKPLKGLEHVQEHLEARDVLLTLDLSLSMEGFLDWDGKDMPPTKLELIRDAALEFVRQHEHDRLGLIVFGDDAFGVWPLSIDRHILERRLERLDSLLPPALRGTHVAKAVERSLDHFDEMQQSDSKILMLLTDGLDSIAPEVADRLVRRLEQHRIKLYVLGMQLSESTSIVTLARQVEGGYYNINNAEELAQALRDIDEQEASSITINRATESRDLYPYFVLPGLILLLMSSVVRSAWVWDV
ncbi:vWA domain-containing protein [Candidatus Entotheonella palauensis]|uniref:vWA domain-containing protein n=1 Tax=Candidatus Entotheonella palauensis TaxID=93172 RepID=UPI000B800E6C|nr:VWA domain-containing protein [Candidatus Entotheonella palauensis]